MASALAQEDIVKDGLAFGIEPSNRKYRLRLARYQGLIEAVRDFRARSACGQPQEPLELLDVGAGQGRTLRYLQAAGLDEGIEFYGVDNSAQRREKLFEPDRWNYQLLDVQQGLPFDDESFDIVVCEQVLEHLTEPDGVLREIARVLKPGGMAVLGVPNFPPLVDAFRRHVVPRIDRITGKKRDHEQVFTKASFTRMIEQRQMLKVRKVQAFRLLSGGAFSRLENYEWWYRLSRRVATALSSLAVEIQVIAERVPAHAPAQHDAHAAPLRPAAARVWPVTIAMMLYAIMLLSIGWLLSDGTHESLFHDTLGAARRASVWMWFAAAVAIVWLLRSRIAIALPIGGTAVFAGLIEAGFLREYSGASSVAAALFTESAPLMDRMSLVLFLGVGTACVLVTLAALWRMFRSSGGTREPWVRLLIVAVIVQVISETIERTEHGFALGASLSKSINALEEGLEVALPLLLIIAVAALAAAWAQSYRMTNRQPVT